MSAYNDGQKHGAGGASENNGQPSIRHDPTLGKKPVPAVQRDGDISSETPVTSKFIPTR